MNPVLRFLPFILGIVIVILLGVLIFVPTPKKNKLSGETPALTTYTTKLGKTLEVNVRPNDVIKSPFVIRGVASGWYFEGEFPVKILDSTNRVLGQRSAAAQADWMTSAPVPFAASIEFQKPATATGTLLLMNANPSQMRQYDDEVRVPVRF